MTHGRWRLNKISKQSWLTLPSQQVPAAKFRWLLCKLPKYHTSPVRLQFSPCEETAQWTWDRRVKWYWPAPPPTPPSIDLDKWATEVNYKFVLGLYLIVIVKAEELYLKLSQLLLYSVRWNADHLPQEQFFSFLQCGVVIGTYFVIITWQYFRQL